MALPPTLEYQIPHMNVLCDAQRISRRDHFPNDIHHDDSNAQSAEMIIKLHIITPWHMSTSCMSHPSFDD